MSMIIMVYMLPFKKIFLCIYLCVHMCVCVHICAGTSTCVHPWRPEGLLGVFHYPMPTYSFTP